MLSLKGACACSFSSYLAVLGKVLQQPAHGHGFLTGSFHFPPTSMLAAMEMKHC